ncbi:MAG: 30S ribosomal protein S2 [Anaerolineales bacterium]|nr:30S ribosomal protein S2 [Anaerolineales bacterium]
MAVINMKELLETGVHFGHRTRKWNPKMKPFIFTERNGIHIIDLQQTLESLTEVYNLVRDTVADGGSILFVGTKRQAQETIQSEADRCGMPYVNSRWLGGTLTNWQTIRSRINELERLEKQRDEGIFEKLTKKEVLTLTRKMDRLEERLGGIRKMQRVPNLLFIVDVRREETSIHEANLLDIPVTAMVDTNCDPEGVDYIIPANDDAIRAIKLICSKIADAVLEGKALRKDVEEEIDEPGAGEAAEKPVEEIEIPDEELLGAATLAKLKSGEYDAEAGRAEASEQADSEKASEKTDADEAGENQETDEETDESEED